TLCLFYRQSDTPNIVLYDYQASRSGACTAGYLAGFRGYLQVDGYQGDEQTGARLVGCMAHARRKFMEAKQAQGKNKTGKADIALSLIQSLYRVEQQIKGLNPAEKYRLRQEKALPILDKLSAWLFSHIPRGAQASAILYSVIETAKANGLIPFDYVMTCLDELCQPTLDLEKLLPWKKVISKV
ncbi:IS66 family transposase, partial [Xenorhabdus szentirmaii]|uniref:IS66 family transposase n=1 Tax=Xenorhabdus szentirmaii TaxID=290112 RepID=UPI0019B25690